MSFKTTVNMDKDAAYILDITFDSAGLNVLSLIQQDLACSL